jgi:2-amino-4-hydroxy-6-hydroxymethyldihydropteridine diphosphokinase
MNFTAYVGVGSNLGDRKRILDEAQDYIYQIRGISVECTASIYESEPIGGPPQGRYLNTVWKVKTCFEPHELLVVLQETEKQFKRDRFEQNGPRTLDLDLLFFGTRVINTEHLIVPHPRLHERWFVVRPMCDIRADFVHPVLKKRMQDLLNEIYAHTEKR